ncbi:L,D-transpeptidase family protein [Candidatus Rariloculus sp.]|uniref:L,D-transpeptidase family protein n=1 Tax=Candidatus Rariloculus sp. TaxID=3101265 RepID=UPI003D0D95FA
MRTFALVRMLPVLAALTAPAAHAQSGPLPPLELADKILVEKAERKLYLLKAGNVLREFDIALGLFPKGHKHRSGDFRTPEGLYQIDARHSGSNYFLALRISYPNEQDRARARALDANPGGQIMIHGQPNEPKYDESWYRDWDWTDGCIAVSNSDMVDIWLMTQVPTPIEIRP